MDIKSSAFIFAGSINKEFKNKNKGRILLTDKKNGYSQEFYISDKELTQLYQDLYFFQSNQMTLAAQSSCWTDLSLDDLSFQQIKEEELNKSTKANLTKQENISKQNWQEPGSSRLDTSIPIKIKELEQQKLEENKKQKPTKWEKFKNKNPNTVQVIEQVKTSCKKVIKVIGQNNLEKAKIKQKLIQQQEDTKEAKEQIILTKNIKQERKETLIAPDATGTNQYLEDQIKKDDKNLQETAETEKKEQQASQSNFF